MTEPTTVEGADVSPGGVAFFRRQPDHVADAHLAERHRVGHALDSIDAGLLVLGDDVLVGPSGQVRVGLLGPVVLFGEGGAVPSRSSLLRTALALLSLEPQSVVSTARITEELWGDHLPQDPRASLQVTATRLRKWLAEAGVGEGSLRYSDGGYRLDLPAAHVDVSLFQDAAAAAGRAGDPEQMRHHCEVALDLWRAEVFSGCAGSVQLEIEAARLREVRLQVQECRVDALCALGRDATALADLQTLVAEYPARERLTSLAMLALYRQGRQHEALEMFQSTRRYLLDEYGLDPGPDLVALEARILAHAADLGDRRPLANLAERPRIPQRPPLVGRRDQVDLIAARLRRDGRGSVVVVSGEAGAGKSTLIGAVTHDAVTAGAMVGADGFDGDPAPLSGWIGALARVGVELGAGVSGGPTVVAELIRTQLAARATTAPVLVTLEDAHLADTASLAVFVAVARAGLPPRVCLVVTARDPDLVPRPAWSAAHAEAAMSGAIEDVRLVELERSNVTELARMTWPLLDDEGLGRISSVLWEQSAGHPLHLLALIRTMASEAELEACLAAALEVPRTLRPLLQHQLSTLTPACHDLLEVIAVLGPHTARELAAVHGGTPLAVAQAMRPAIELGVAVEEKEGRFDLRHPLTRAAVLERIATPTRQYLHHLRFTQLEATAGEAFAALRHALGAGPLVDELRLARVRLAAGQLAYRRGAFAEAVDILVAARTALSGAERASATTHLGLSLAELGRAEEADELLDEVIEAGSEVDLHLQVIAATGEALGVSARGSPRRRERLRRVWARSARRRDRDRLSLLVALLNEEGLAVGEAGTPGLREDHDELVEVLGSPVDRARVLAARDLAGEWIEPQQRLSVVEDGYAAARDLGDVRTRLEMIRVLMTASLVAGDVERALDLCWELGREADRAGRAYSRWFARITEVAILDAVGDPHAESQAQAAFTLGTDLGIPDALGAYAVHLAVPAWVGGRLGSLMELVDQAVAMYPQIPAWLGVAATARSQEGLRQEASSGLWRYIDAREASSVRVVDRTGLCFAATVAADLGDARAAGALLAALPPAPEGSSEIVVVGVGAALAGPLGLFVGLLEATAGDLEAARGHIAAATALSTQLGWTPWITACGHVEGLTSGSVTEVAGSGPPYPLGIRPQEATRIP
ncbi:MAG: hypothetical protein NVS3B12_32340 [Acidimicrobiales bacterium]